jgi:arsenite-transporting ATPase
VEELRSFGAAVYGLHDPLVWPPPTARPAPSPDAARRAGDVLTMPLPGAVGEDVRLARSGAVIFITIGPYRRSLPLPPHLRERVATDARVQNGQLEVEFAGP